MRQREEARLQASLIKAHEKYRRALEMRAYSKTHSAEISSDLVQETFLKAWKYLLTGRKVLSMKALLYHVLNHLIIDEYRKHKTSSLDALLERGYEPGADQTEQMIDMLDSQQLPQLVGHLPPAYQQVLRLRYLESRSLEEVSFATGLSMNTIAVQIHRGLTKLKSLYGHAPAMVAGSLS